MMPRVQHLIVASAVGAFAPLALRAQTPAAPPPTMEACYVPASGTVYRITTAQSPAAGAPSACLNVTHVRFMWNQQGSIGPAGPQGTPGPAGLVSRNGVGQYDLDNVNGFASKGVLGTGSSIADIARGSVLLWHPRSASFRAGQANGEWDEANLGTNSVAMGLNTLASGRSSIAIGLSTDATGNSSVALGTQTRSTGDASTALGSSTTASGAGATSMGNSTWADGVASTAMGHFTSAQGMYSVALGARADAAFDGSFVFGDAASRTQWVAADRANQFMARASGGVVFQVNPTGSIGCYLTQSSGGWQCTSDRGRKTGFRAVDGERLLGTLREMPITTWRYRTDSTRTTHLGPTAQDFKVAFGLGADSLTIGSVDAQGVALAAAKALEVRTRALIAENAELRAQLASISARLEAVEMRKLASSTAGPP